MITNKILKNKIISEKIRLPCECIIFWKDKQKLVNGTWLPATDKAILMGFTHYQEDHEIPTLLLVFGHGKGYRMEYRVSGNSLNEIKLISLSNEEQKLLLLGKNA
jgi:hypothetical protein